MPNDVVSVKAGRIGHAHGFDPQHCLDSKTTQLHQVRKMMKRFLERSLVPFSAFAMAACLTLTGCTDTVVGHEDVSETNQTLLLAPDEAPVQHGPSYEWNGKINFRRFEPPSPPADSTSIAPGNGNGNGNGNGGG